MFKYLIISFSLLFLHVHAFAITTESMRPYRFAEVKRVNEVGSLPPKLNVVFDLMCNEKFLKVVRYDEAESKTGKITIAVGVLVEENLLSSCAGKSKECPWSLRPHQLRCKLS